MEQFLSDGVILLQKDIREYQLIKTIRVDKMRGMQFDEQPRRYTITSRGFQVFNAESVLI
jgi:KaiC/GvpD/RAD55 family RecA-like ATPase